MSIPVTIVQGAQWGSEAKGSIAGWLCMMRPYDFAVRTGAINAGHTVYYKGKPYVNQQLPVGWVNRNTKLVIGAGAYVHIQTLLKELDMIQEATGEDPRSRLIIDHRATVHLDMYADESKSVNRHHLIGATGKGCAEAIIHKIADRGRRDLLLSRNSEIEEVLGFKPAFMDTAHELTAAYNRQARIMLEGTQGELLDFHLGPWPYVTSRQTTPAAWVAEAGLSPSLDYEIVLVARTYPIRVAGNSGPMPSEVSWGHLARLINKKLDILDVGDHPLRVSEDALQEYDDAVYEIGLEAGVSDLNLNYLWTAGRRVNQQALLSEYSNQAFNRISEGARTELRKLFEFTTVTKKLRRIALPDGYDLVQTYRRLQPAWCAVTFLNYQFPELHGTAEVHSDASHWARQLIPGVRLVTNGPRPEHVVEL